MSRALCNPPIALWELTEARKMLRQHSQANASESAVFANVLQQRRLSKKQRTGRNSVVAKKGFQMAAELAAPSEEESRDATVTNDIQPYPVEIWESE